MKKFVLLGIVAAIALGGAALMPVERGDAQVAASDNKPQEMTLGDYADDAPGRPIPLVFLHHSVGGQLLAAPGDDRGKDSIYESHPEGGDLRNRLKESGYLVHEASYKSEVGDRTDTFDWLPKFRSQMPQILRTKMQDERLDEGERNEVVIFKSCFPNTKFLEMGKEPGKADGPDLNVANAKATMRALRDEFQRHPDTLFVYVTSPPLAPKLDPQPLWKIAAKAVLGRSFGNAELATTGRLTRQFNAWLVAKDGWLADYPHQNVAVFNYWNILTGEGQSDLLVYPTRGGFDPHPARAGNERAATAFVPFLNKAVRRAGLVKNDATSADEAPSGAGE